MSLWFGGLVPIWLQSVRWVSGGTADFLASDEWSLGDSRTCAAKPGSHELKNRTISHWNDQVCVYVCVCVLPRHYGKPKCSGWPPVWKFFNPPSAGERAGCPAHLSADTFTLTHTFEHRDIVILCCLRLMWATKESSQKPGVEQPQWEEQPAAPIEVHLSMATCRIKTTTTQPLRLVHLCRFLQKTHC